MSCVQALMSSVTSGACPVQLSQESPPPLTLGTMSRGFPEQSRNAQDHKQVDGSVMDTFSNLQPQFSNLFSAFGKH